VENFEKLLPLIPVLILAYFAWRYFKYGSLTGAMLGGRISRTIGEVKVSTSSFSSSVLRVGVLETDPLAPPQVALTVVSKAVLAASMVPFKLSADQARQLAALLNQATGH
jgi:hypothetical protein